MKIALFGEEILSEIVLKSLIDNGHLVKLVLVPHRQGNVNLIGLKNIAEKYSISFIHAKEVNSLSVKNKLIELELDLIICAHFKSLLKKEIYTQSKFGAINIHPSLLPKYRGLSPINQALIHGDSKTGVTIHFIDEFMDTGDLIIQKEISISKDDYISDLLVKILMIYKTIFLEAIKLIDDDKFQPIKQVNASPSYFPSLTKKDRELNLDRSKLEIFNQVRALSAPFKGAFYKNIIIWRIDFVDRQLEEVLMKKHPQTGMFFDEKNDIIIFRLLDGILITDDFEKIN